MVGVWLVEKVEPPVVSVVLMAKESSCRSSWTGACNVVDGF